MFINLLNCIMVIIVMVMSRGIVSHVICMFYFLCERIAIIKVNKSICFSYIGIHIRVNCVMFIDSNIINKIVMLLLCV